MIPEKSLPDVAKNGTFASPAIARASNVLPVPGSPANNTPRGTRAPNALNFSLFFKNSTISINSCFSASIPATSAKVVFGLPVVTLVGFCDNKALLKPPDAPPRNPRNNQNTNNPINNNSRPKTALSAILREESNVTTAPLSANFVKNSGL